MKGKIRTIDFIPRGATLAHGCFDLLHIGHIRYLQWAEKLDAYSPLIVTLTADDYFPNKGHGRPAFSEDVRAESLAALQCVNYVSIVRDKTALPVIKALQPKFFVKGAGDLLQAEQEAVMAYGGKMMFHQRETEWDGRNAYSSTRILSGEYMAPRPRGVGEGMIGVE